MAPNGASASRRRKHPLPSGWNHDAFKLLMDGPYRGKPQPRNVLGPDLRWVKKALEYGETLQDIEAAFRGAPMIWANLKHDWWRPALVFGKRMDNPGYPFYVRCREAGYRRGKVGDLAKRIAAALYGEKGAA